MVKQAGAKGRAKEREPRPSKSNRKEECGRCRACRSLSARTCVPSQTNQPTTNTHPPVPASQPPTALCAPFAFGTSLCVCARLSPLPGRGGPSRPPAKSTLSSLLAAPSSRPPAVEVVQPPDHLGTSTSPPQSPLASALALQQARQRAGRPRPRPQILNFPLFSFARTSTTPFQLQPKTLVSIYPRRIDPIAPPRP